MYAASDSIDGHLSAKLNLVTLTSAFPIAGKERTHSQIQPYLKNVRSNLMTISGVGQVRLGNGRLFAGSKLFG